MDNTFREQLSAWLNNASAHDVGEITQTIVNKVANSDQNTKQRFVAEIKNNPNLTRMFEPTTTN